MEREEYLRKYEKECYEPATQKFLRKTMEYILANHDEIIAQFTKELETFMEKIGKMQRFQNILAGQIAISILRTSIWEGKTKIRFDCYDKGKEAGVNIAYQYMEADFLTTEWENYRQELLHLVKEGNYERYVREAQITCYMSQAIQRLIMLFVMDFKYYLCDADYLKHYEEMLTEDVFIITAGEYLDWQKLLYVKVPEIDIIANPKNEPLVFQKMKEKKYRNQELTDMDLTQARFTNCEFSKCIFEQVVLNDVRFENCLFRDVNMQSGSMYGVTFINCTFQNTDMSGMEKEYHINEGEMVRLKEIYREVLFIECIMDGKKVE